jgi:hypothetical protein
VDLASRTLARERFIAARASGASVAAACRAAGITRETAYAWRASDSAFRRAEEDALADARDRLRDLISDALERGLEERTIHPDGSVTTRYRRSDRVLLARAVALLEEHRPEPLRVEVSPGARPVVELTPDAARRAWATLAEGERREWLAARGLEALPAIAGFYADAIPATPALSTTPEAAAPTNVEAEDPRSAPPDEAPPASPPGASLS